jgi:release factor glutamine methyltransferase
VGSDPASAGLPDRLGEALRHVRSSLADAGIFEPEIEARRLVQQACGLAGVVLATEPARRLTGAEKNAIAAMLARRCRREPLGRIGGLREFYGRSFQLSPETLEPRADTETLIDAVLEIVRAEGWRDKPLEILDLGTGTGCILLTLLAELPNARGLGVDISSPAAATAEDNAARLDLAGRARFEVRDGPAGIGGRFDLVVSNPPYIASADIAGLAPEVRLFDPLAALDGGADGLAFYRNWIPVALRLAPAGWVLFEVGAGQAGDVARMLAGGQAGGGAGRVRRWQDLGGHTRVVAIGPHA